MRWSHCDSPCRMTQDYHSKSLSEGARSSYLLRNSNTGLLYWNPASLHCYLFICFSQSYKSRSIITLCLPLTTPPLLSLGLSVTTDSLWWRSRTEILCVLCVVARRVYSLPTTVTSQPLAPDLRVLLRFLKRVNSLESQKTTRRYRLGTSRPASFCVLLLHAYLLPLVNELRTEVRFVCGIILAVFVQAGRLHSMLALLLRMEHQVRVPIKFEMLLADVTDEVVP
ncbi:hypothetical protein PISMIDRAFT_213371 [Pisolithus microcarpus 441]|uniref:Uncharacterized protein n=1 Tax=Pisolithus microcarpus 441 TaxID=765257 RepID=A0A0C9Z5N1_9AGAM|nr:hypothetical protein PISMIDRAFT_213371 [Pisolithus microcarpus 441]